VVGTAGVVACGDRRVVTQERRPGAVDAVEQGLVVLGHDGEVFGGVLLGEQRRLAHRPREEHAAGVALERALDDLAALAVVDLSVDLVDDGPSRLFVVGHRHHRGVGVVFGLGEHVGRDEFRVGGVVRHHEEFARPREEVDLDVAPDRGLGGCDPPVAGPDDDVSRGDGLGAVGKRRNGLCAAGLVDGVGTGHLDGRQGGGVQLLGRGRRDRDVFDARHLCRDDAHQRTRGVGGGPAGRVDAGALDGPEATAQFPAAEVRAPVFGQLSLVERADVLGCRLDGREQVLVDHLDRTLCPVGHVDVANGDAVELLGEIPDGDVALLADAGDDVADVLADGLDAGLAVEQRPPLPRVQVGDGAYVHTRSTGAVPILFVIAGLPDGPTGNAFVGRTRIPPTTLAVTDTQVGRLP
jgi:hypothetical protein